MVYDSAAVKYKGKGCSTNFKVDGHHTKYTTRDPPPFERTKRHTPASPSAPPSRLKQPRSGGIGGNRGGGGGSGGGRKRSGGGKKRMKASFHHPSRSMLSMYEAHGDGEHDEYGWKDGGGRGAYGGTNHTHPPFSSSSSSFSSFSSSGHMYGDGGRKGAGSGGRGSADAAAAAAAAASASYQSEFDDDDNHDYCDICSRGSSSKQQLYCCEGCHAAFHAACLPDEDFDQVDLWACPDCRFAFADMEDDAATGTRRQQKIFLATHGWDLQVS